MKQVDDPNGLYSFAVPADSQVQQQGGVIGTFSAAHAVSVSCMGVAKGVSSLDEFVQMMASGYPQQVQGWKEVGRKKMQVSGHPAVVLRATAQPGGQQLVADYVFVVTRQHQFLLMAMCPDERLRQAEPMFRQIIASWRIGG